MKATPVLIGSVCGSLVGVWAVLYKLQPQDKVSVSRGVCLLSLGFMFFISLFDLINHVFLYTARGKQLVKKYKLTTFDVVDTANKLVSAVQSILSCITGYIICSYSCYKNFLTASHFMSQSYAWFGASYFIYDIYSMYKVYSVKEPHVAERVTHSRVSRLTDFIVNHPVMLFHHLFIGFYGFLVVVHLRANFGDCTFGFVFLMELSTPFVSLRTVLSRFKLKHTVLYLVNGIVMIFVFFVCRILVFAYLLLRYSQVVELPFLYAMWSLPTICVISTLILLLPQFYWFYLMVKGACSLLLHRTDKQNKQEQHIDVNEQTNNSSAPE